MRADFFPQISQCAWYKTATPTAYSSDGKILEVERMVHSRVALFLCLFAVWSSVTDSFAAGPTATLTGRVTDTTGAVIAGVKVEVTNVETNVVYRGETNDQGLYHIPNLPPGIYRVLIQKFAFRTVVKPDIELHVQDVIALNFSMEVGSVTESITVEAGAPLIEAGPQRGGDFSSTEVSKLPLVSLSPISLARTLPGTIEIQGSTVYATNMYDDQYAMLFSVNGQRPRANKYLLDSTDNNEIQYTGVAQRFNITDAVQEVSVQTGNFGVEFGRAGGGILNVVTRSGTNNLHGTLLWRYQSELFNSQSNIDKSNKSSGLPNSVFSRNIYGFTAGGPVRTDKTFFFGGFQQDTRRATDHFPLVLPTEAAVATLREVFPSNERLDSYLSLMGSLRGIANPNLLQLGRDPLTGVDRGAVQFGSTALSLPTSRGGPEWLVRLDHNPSKEHRLAFRHIYSSRVNSPTVAFFPGFMTEQAATYENFLFTDQYTFSPTWTNEYRFSYARQDAEEPQRLSPKSIPEAQTQPRIVITSISSPGVRTERLLFRRVNGFLFQETQTKLSGRHTFRYGVEFLRQLATQRGTSYYLGELNYIDTPNLEYSAFANFLDDYSGGGSMIRKDFSATIFHPDQFHQTYFFQDMWLPAPSLSLTLGIRYENFGQVANALRFPAFAGPNPDDFLKPNRVNTDNNNFGPAFGLAWSPTFRSGWRHRLFGENNTVWRGGYQISYDAFFTQMLSLQLADTPPNGNRVDLRGANTGRGTANWSQQLPTAQKVPDAMDAQTGLLEKDLRSPYTERWSFGFQRQFSKKLVIDGSYVGSESHKLTTWDDANPMQANGSRLYPNIGPRAIRTSQGNSSYHAMQWRVDRRLGNGFGLTASYTWSRNIDSASDGVGALEGQSSRANRTSVKVAQGGLRLDRGPSDFDRTHRFTILYMWSVPGPHRGVWKHPLGGWSIAGITTFQSGAPFTVLNGGSSQSGDDSFGSSRPDIGNPRAPISSRAKVVEVQTCATGYQNPDTLECVTPADVHWVQRGSALPPNDSTVGRNTLLAGGINNWDVSLSKAFQIAEEKRIEFRWEALNALNHPQFTQFPERSVTSPGPGPGSPSPFLNRDFTNSGIRSMWVQLKLVF